MTDFSDIIQPNSLEHKKKLEQVRAERFLAVQKNALEDDSPIVEATRLQGFDEMTKDIRRSGPENFSSVTSRSRVKSSVRQRSMKHLIGFNATILGIGSSPMATANYSPVKVSEMAKNNIDFSNERLRILRIWRFLYNILDFSKFTALNLKDTRVNDLINKWIMMTSVMLADITKFGCNYSNLSSSKYERVEFNVIHEMFLDKLDELFYALFIGDKLQSQDNEASSRLVLLKSRLLEVYITIITRVKFVPLDIVEKVLRQLNADPKIFLNLIEETNSFEVPFFVLEFRKHLKVGHMLLPELYLNKQKLDRKSVV